jgi:hypothetical protein
LRARAKVEDLITLALEASNLDKVIITVEVKQLHMYLISGLCGDVRGDSLNEALVAYLKKGTQFLGAAVVQKNRDRADIAKDIERTQRTIKKLEDAIES